MTNKLRIAVIFGGRSGEHEVSLVSASSVIQAIDPQKYDVIPIAITKEGQWLPPGQAARLLPPSVSTKIIGDAAGGKVKQVAILGDPTQQELMHFDGKTHLTARQPVDVVFPVLHGPYGEDGTIQGLLELVNLPYVGCGVLASAVGMDKEVMKRLFREAGLPIAPFLSFTRSGWERNPQPILRRVVKELGWPVFVKPANLGSSVGISKAKTRDQLSEAINLAGQYDRKILVEKAIDGREVEVSVLGNENPMASLPGEVIPGAEFYDYDDKYINDTAQLMIPAKLSKSLTTKVQNHAIRAFQAVDGAGMARVDFFIEHGTNRVIVNEINTIPGFTKISMYPKLWEASGLPYSELIDRLIQLAIERHQEKSRSRISR